MADPFNIYEAIDAVRRRPSLWLRSHSIVELQGFVTGCLYTAGMHDLEKCEQPDFRDLDCFVAERLLCERPSQGWCNILLRECGGDESKALDLFFDLVAEFRNSGYESGILRERY